MRKSKKFFTIMMVWIIGISVTASTSFAIDNTIGLLQNDPGAYEGYTLFAPIIYNSAYLINNNGQKVHSWDNINTPRMSVYLREDGLLLASALGGEEFGMAGPGVGGRLQLLDWDGSIVWDYLHADSNYRHHHEVLPMENGNILIIAWEKHTLADAIASGRDPALLTDGEIWSEQVIEVEPVGFDSVNIIWEWHAWDHIVQEFDSTKLNYDTVYNHPELLHFNFQYSTSNSGQADWLHFNAIAYNQDLDQILLSSNHFSEIILIDHSTSIAEAAGHTGGNSGKGGDILFRWGNPQTYQHGDANDQQLFSTHSGQWVPPGFPGAGNLILFNNGFGRPGGNYSTIEEFSPEMDINGNYLRTVDEPFGPVVADWTYTSPIPSDFYSSRMSSVQRLPNGNTLMCAALSGDFFEITDSETTVWHYISPVTGVGPATQGESLPGVNSVFKNTRYPLDYAGLIGKDLSPKGTVEIYPPCCIADRGNVDFDPLDEVNIADLVFFVDYSFGSSGIAPECFEEADVDGSLTLNIADIVYIVSYMFDSGPVPLPCS